MAGLARLNDALKRQPWYSRVRTIMPGQQFMVFPINAASIKPPCGIVEVVGIRRKLADNGVYHKRYRIQLSFYLGREDDRMKIDDVMSDYPRCKFISHAKTNNILATIYEQEIII